jgi:isopentenyl-diphosphate delta-isomerase
MVEHVVLVDEENNVEGTVPKQAAHGPDTELHRGISVYVFDEDGQLLLQQRSDAKKTWPGFWSNSCCGHPSLDETVLETARRRCREELDLTLTRLTVALPEYQYEFEHDGVVEKELCPVLVAQPKSGIDPNPDEVQATRWAAWDDVTGFDDESVYSPWFLDEVEELQESDVFNQWFEEVT